MLCFLPDFSSIAVTDQVIFHPVVKIPQKGTALPQAGLEVPGDALVAGFDIGAAGAELSQPGQGFGCAAQLVHGIGGSGLGAP